MWMSFYFNGTSLHMTSDEQCRAVDDDDDDDDVQWFNVHLKAD